MKSFSSFRNNSVVYKKPDYESLGNEEHGENVHQSNALKSGEMETSHPAISNAIHHFAKNKPAFVKALSNSSIEKVKKGTVVHNSEIGQHIDTVESKDKLKRVQGMIKNKQAIHRPIILRHKDESGNLHHHLLAGNTRATSVGYGVEAHHIDV